MKALRHENVVSLLEVIHHHPSPDVLTHWYAHSYPVTAGDRRPLREASLFDPGRYPECREDPCDEGRGSDVGVLIESSLS